MDLRLDPKRVCIPTQPFLFFLFFTLGVLHVDLAEKTHVTRIRIKVKLKNTRWCIGLMNW
jgi:hypothetical protein